MLKYVMFRLVFSAIEIVANCWATSYRSTATCNWLLLQWHDGPVFCYHLLVFSPPVCAADKQYETNCSVRTSAAACDLLFHHAPSCYYYYRFFYHSRQPSVSAATKKTIFKHFQLIYVIFFFHFFRYSWSCQVFQTLFD